MYIDSMASLGKEPLPIDMWGEVLSWLPAKEVSRSRCVSKAFSASSSDRFFFLSQSRHHAGVDSGVLLFRRSDGYFEFSFTDALSGVPHEAMEFLREDARTILASGNGLILYESNQKKPYRRLGVYNPVRGTWLPLPYPKDDEFRVRNILGVAMTFNQNDHNHKVFSQLTSSNDGIHYDIICMTATAEWDDLMECWHYSSRQRLWKVVSKEINKGPRNLNFDIVVASDGVVYLASDCGQYMIRTPPYVVAVDVAKGSSEILPLPEKVLTASPDCEIEIAGYGVGSLCLILCDRAAEFTIWEMKKTVTTMTWVCRIDGLSMVAMGLEPEPVKKFSMINDDTLIFTVQEAVYSYNVKSGVSRRLITGLQQGWYTSMCSYSNTFRPCGRFEMTLIKI